MKQIFVRTTLAGFATVSLFVTASLLSGCGEASKKDVNDANENLKEASKDLKEAVTDANEDAKRKATADWQIFRNESDSATKAIDKQMKELKERIAKANNKEKARLNDELNTLEHKLNDQKARLDQKNTEFEADMKAFTETVVTKYESFKREFKHDNDELATALNDLFKDNVK